MSGLRQACVRSLAAARAVGLDRNLLLVGPLLPLLLVGCTEVDTRSATPAFAQAAHASREAFAALDLSEQRAFTDLALAQPPGDVRIFPARACLVEDGAGIAAAVACRAQVVVRGNPIDIEAAGPQLLKAANGLAFYADCLAQAAAADDLNARNVAARQIATSVGSLAALAGVPGAQAIGTFVADLAHARDVSRRRRALAKIALAADPAVQMLSVMIGERATALRTNITLARSQALVAAEANYAEGSMAPDRALRAHAVIAAAADVREAASVNTDFSALGQAHRAVITSLEHPKASLSSTLASIDLFGSDALAMRKAFQKGS